MVAPNIQASRMCLGRPWLRSSPVCLSSQTQPNWDQKGQRAGGRRTGFSVTVSFPAMETHSFMEHSFNAYGVPSPRQTQGEQEDSRRQLTIPQTHEIHRFEKSRTQSNVVKAMFKTSMKQDGADGKHPRQRPRLV